ncbi:ER membrane protein complex subunit 6 [Abortiporus biennis]
MATTTAADNAAQLLFPPNVQYNASKLYTVKFLSSCLAGAVAGVLGLENWLGFALFIFSTLFTSTCLSLKCKGKPAKFVQGGLWELVNPGQENTFSFVLAWTLFYGIVHGMIFSIRTPLRVFLDIMLFQCMIKQNPSSIPNGNFLYISCFYHHTTICQIHCCGVMAHGPFTEIRITVPSFRPRTSHEHLEWIHAASPLIDVVTKPISGRKSPRLASQQVPTICTISATFL